jgi:IS1 family transposase
MNKLSSARRAQIVRALVEGNSIRATCRMTDTAKGTVLKLLADIGQACDGFSDERLRSLPCKRVQLDEIWSFVYAKKANVPDARKGEFGCGDVWTWTAIDADTKLVVSWHLGTRDTSSGMTFARDLRSRLTERVQLTSDGHNAYLFAIAASFQDGSADYAQLHKLFGATYDAGRYSPPACVGTKRKAVFGNPDPRHVSTSFAERQNLSMRMSMRRFTRLTNGFSKKLDNHAAALALHFAWYNFCRVHLSLRMTPAMAAGVTNRVLGAEDLVALLD